MRRDDWGTRNRPTINATLTKVNETPVRNNSDSLIADPVREQFTYNNSNNVTVFSGKFFGSYDPEVGIHTASVLGGLLSFLVLYVIYRTKCRKRLIKAFNTCAMKYFPEEFDEVRQKSSFKECDIENGQESKGLQRNRSVSTRHQSNMTGGCFSKTSEQGSDINGNSEEAYCGEDYDEMDDYCCDNNVLLPDLEEDIERATAEWVRNVQDLDPTDKQLSSIILKIPPDLLTCPYRFREKIHSVSEYCNYDGLANISHMNQSLPLLIKTERGVISPYANSRIVENCVRQSFDYASVDTQEDLDIRPKQLEVKHQSGAKVPLDICPIIKIQHYHSRSKRRLTSLNGSSSDDSSSSDPSLTPLLSIANADLMTVYQPYKPDNISVSRNSVSASNTHPGTVPSGGLETSL